MIIDPAKFRIHAEEVLKTLYSEDGIPIHPNLKERFIQRIATAIELEVLESAIPLMAEKEKAEQERDTFILWFHVYCRFMKEHPKYK